MMCKMNNMFRLVAYKYCVLQYKYAIYIYVYTYLLLYMRMCLYLKPHTI